MRTSEWEVRLRWHISNALDAALGHRLKRITIWPLRGEWPEEPFVPPCYIGGEISLLFEGGLALYLSWEEKAGWDDHFSIQCRRSSNWLPDALSQRDVSSKVPWERYADAVLEGWRIWGSNDTPHVVEMRCASGSLFVGDGYQLEIGDGDDVIIELDARATIGLDLLATSNARVIS